LNRSSRHHFGWILSNYTTSSIPHLPHLIIKDTVTTDITGGVVEDITKKDNDNDTKNIQKRRPSEKKIFVFLLKLKGKFFFYED